MSLFYKLALAMGFVVTVSNYLVQFPINYFDLNEILTYGAFSYPVTFLITDLANRAYGKIVAKKIVYIGFLFFSILGLYLHGNYVINKNKELCLSKFKSIYFFQPIFPVSCLIESCFDPQKCFFFIPNICI